jgi:radical SAM protein with 4Fe4S-binding SPASM domain
MKIKQAIITFYRSLSLDKQRLISKIFYRVSSLPVISEIYHQIYSRRINSRIQRFPTLLNIETCNICNLRCVMCPYDVITRPKATMNIGLYRKIIDDARNKNMTDMCLNDYGEPLLDKYIFERIAYAKLRGMRVGFNSNGTLLLKDENIKHILESNLDWIIFSIDAVTKETYEKIRVGADFEQVVTGIKELIQTKQRTGATTPKVQISCCVQAKNYSEVIKQKKIFYQLFKGVDTISLAPVSIRGDGIERLPRNLDFRTPITSRRHTYPCDTLFTSMTITADGTVVLCCIDYDGQVQLGNLNTQTLTQIWESEQYQKIRQLHLDGRGANVPMCNNCKELEIASFRWFI